MKSKEVLCLIFAAALILSGCKKEIIIFESQINKNEKQEVSLEEMSYDLFYVKDSTRFYPVYEKGRSFGGIADETAPERLLWYMEDSLKIPDCYQNELLAYKTEELGLTNIHLERFKSLGYSLGLYGGKWEENGIVFNRNENVVKNSVVYEAFRGCASDNIKIVRLDNHSVQKEDCSISGTITGLEPKKNYQLGFYDGSVYRTVQAQADTWFLASFETFLVENSKFTKNGYLSIKIPEDYKSGYYRVEDAGLFAYYAHEKGSVPAGESMEEAFYTEEEKEPPEYRQYVLQIASRAENIRFSIPVSEEQKKNEEIEGILQAPDGTIYRMKTGEDGLEVSVQEVMPGRWTIKLSPWEIKPAGMPEAISVELPAENMEEEYPIEFKSAQGPTDFYIDYTGKGYINAILTEADGTTYDFAQSEEGRLVCRLDYVKEGTYTIFIYHAQDVRISGTGRREALEDLESDRIIISG